jgi:hypothetical protein
LTVSHQPVTTERARLLRVKKERHDVDPHQPGQALHVAGAFAAVSISPVVRFICHFLIVWMTLLAGGAHALADARHEASHAPVTAAVMLTESADTDLRAAAQQAPGATELEVIHDKAQSENCSYSHCGYGHAAGMLPTLQTSLPAASRDMALTRHVRWSSSRFATNIERPKWAHTTPAVVNL